MMLNEYCDILTTVGPMHSRLPDLFVSTFERVQLRFGLPHVAVCSLSTKYVGRGGWLISRMDGQNEGKLHKVFVKPEGRTGAEFCGEEGTVVT